jgi:hypothetical protein
MAGKSDITLEGYVTLKRRDKWVKRFAVLDIDKKEFRYRKYFGEPTDKLVLSLAGGVRIKEGKRKSGQKFFSI